MSDILEVTVYTVASFVILFALAKLLGKKQIAQMDFIDYAIGISIGSIAGNMATDLSAPFYHYIIAMSGFFLLDIAINLIGRKNVFLKRLTHGKASALIYEGKIIYKNLKKSRLDVNQLLSLCRSKDYFDIEDIYYAVLETSGELSIIPTATQRPIVAKDLVIKSDEILQLPSLPNYLICDGEVSHSGLSEIGKNEKWLFERLDISSKESLKNILLASYDDETDTLSTHLKE